MLYRSLQQVEEANRRRLDFFFDDGKFRTLNMRVESDLLYGCYFLTSSDPFNQGVRFFKIRQVNHLGDISTLDLASVPNYLTAEDALNRLDHYLQHNTLLERVAS